MRPAELYSAGGRRESGQNPLGARPSAYVPLLGPRDPAALCYEAYQAADKRDLEFLIADTAGRLHTKSNLMAELAKVKRSLAKHDPAAPHEVLLVIDAATGSNALSQAKQFHEAIGLTGLIATKLDGSGKGGVVVAIQDELGIPTRFVGTGEKLEDFKEFDGRDFIANMI